jgi:hypothetical protein
MKKILVISEKETRVLKSVTEAKNEFDKTDSEITAAIRDGTGIRDKQGKIVFLDELLES